MKTNNEILLKPYQKIFSKPQLFHFNMFITGLSACEIPTISHMSNLHTKSRISMNRVLTESPWKIDMIKSGYHNQVKPFTRTDSAWIIDDTNSKRPYTKKVEKTDYHFDHTSSKEYTKAIDSYS